MKKLKLLYKQNKVVINTTLLFLLVLINIVFLKTETETETEKPGINSWNSIIIGQKVSTEELKALQPISINKEGSNLSYKYKSEFRAFPNKIVVNDQQNTEFIKEYILATKGHSIDQYIQELGQYDLELFVLEIGVTARAGVFLQDGLVVVFQNANRLVVQKWYFIPTDEKTFMETWDKQLSKTGPGVHF